MTNREAYKNAFRGCQYERGDLCGFIQSSLLGKHGLCCPDVDCDECLGKMFETWLDEEYEEPPKPEVDWSKVPVDTLVRVREREDEEWLLRHFKGINDKHLRCRYEAWESGATSKTANGEYLCWSYCELVEDEDNGSKTVGTKILNHCEMCKYFHTEVREGGGWLEICEVTGGRVIGSDEVKSDNCPFMEVSDDK